MDALQQVTVAVYELPPQCRTLNVYQVRTEVCTQGCDQAMFALRSSQVGDNQNAQYVSSNEAAWRIFEFPGDPQVQ